VIVEGGFEAIPNAPATLPGWHQVDGEWAGQEVNYSARQAALVRALARIPANLRADFAAMRLAVYFGPLVSLFQRLNASPYDNGAFWANTAAIYNATTDAPLVPMILIQRDVSVSGDLEQILVHEMGHAAGSLRLLANPGLFPEVRSSRDNGILHPDFGLQSLYSTRIQANIPAGEYAKENVLEFEAEFFRKWVYGDSTYLSRITDGPSVNLGPLFYRVTDIFARFFGNLAGAPDGRFGIIGRSSGQTATGAIPLELFVSPQLAATAVRVSIGGVSRPAVLGADSIWTASPWASTSVANGAHFATIVATTAGGEVSSSQVYLDVKN
jgi:hypothetical protein